MFGMGWQEILVIVAIGILVIGPDQLPQVARTIGKMMAQFRRATSDLREAVNEEVHSHQELAELKEFSSNLENEVREFGTSTQEYLEKEIETEERELEKIGREVSGEKEESEPPPPVDDIPTGDYGPILNEPEEPGVTEVIENVAEAAGTTEGATEDAPQAEDEEESEPGPEDNRKETA